MRHDDEIFYPVATLAMNFTKAIQTAVSTADLTFASVPELASEQAQISSDAVTELLAKVAESAEFQEKVLTLKNRWDSTDN